MKALKLFLIFLVLLVSIGISQAPPSTTPDTIGAGGYFDPIDVARAEQATFTLQQEVTITLFMGDTPLIGPIPAFISQTATVFRRCGDGACLVTTAHGVRMDWTTKGSAGIEIKEFLQELERFGMRIVSPGGGDILADLKARVDGLPAATALFISIKVEGLNKFLLFDSVEDKLQIPAFVYQVKFDEDNKWFAITPHITGSDIAVFWAPLASVKPISFCEGSFPIQRADPVFTWGSPVGIPRQFAQGWVSDNARRTYAPGWENLISTRLPSIGGQSGSVVYGPDGCGIGLIKGGIDDITLLVPSGVVNSFLRSIPPEEEPQ